ncbi:MAG: hypothetical protein NWQ29_01940 [Alphaproteobacteria bacterium]|nr:hypothetical protein [Alphaproteobacteria bacterium]
MITFKTTELCRNFVEMYNAPRISLPDELGAVSFGERRDVYKNLTPEKIEELRQQKIKLYNSEKANIEIDSKNKIKTHILQNMLDIFVWMLMFIPHLYFARISRSQKSNSSDDHK